MRDDEETREPEPDGARYEPPALVCLGSVEELTGEIPRGSVPV